MRIMFQECNELEYLDLSNFNTSNVTNMSWMFNKCNKLKKKINKRKIKKEKIERKRIKTKRNMKKAKEEN